MSGNPFKVRNTYLGADGQQYNIDNSEYFKYSKERNSQENIDSYNENFTHQNKYKQSDQKYQDASSVGLITVYSLA